MTDLKGKRILCTFPGRHGDIFWALATCRALAKAVGETVDLAISGKYQGALPIVQAQPYIGRGFALPGWEVQETAPMTPAIPGERAYSGNPREHGYDLTLHLGYQRWPLEPSLPEEILWSAEQQLGVALPDLELHKPWITSPEERAFLPLGVCWTDEWAELKMGVLGSLCWELSAEPLMQLGQPTLITQPGARVAKEWDPARFGHALELCDFAEAMRLLDSAEVVLSCNSALWVLAAGLGRPIVLMEPNPDRQNPLFTPKEWQQCWVLGGDGKPTFDARATVQAVKLALANPEAWKGLESIR